MILTIKTYDAPEESLSCFNITSIIYILALNLHMKREIIFLA